MTGDFAFVGDIHGNLPAVRGLLTALVSETDPHVVFLGDYINKGAAPAEVLEFLLQHCRSGKVTLLRGNHEEGLLDALDRSDLSGFLKVGGATTIRSYVGGRVGPDVLTDLRAAIPSDHIQLLRSMPATFELNDLVAKHGPPFEQSSRYLVSAHVPVGRRPKIGPGWAQVDTGCGSEGGRLTAFLWPSREYLQVDSAGDLIPVVDR